MYSVCSVCLIMMGSLMFILGLMSIGFSYNMIIEWEVWEFNSSLVSMSLVFDYMSLVFLGSVCVISGCIMKYSSYYMEGEVNYLRFVYIVMMFVVSMWLMIISPNMISLLLGWDGLGLTSYALVIFYQNELSGNAGMLTVMSNRVGDVAILVSISLMFGSGCWDYFSLSNSSALVTGMVVLASFTKSAQVPFSAWLPAAMAAPTPVSSLVHSSTLVTAGVYLLIRFSSVINSSDMSYYMLIVSIVTMVMAGLGAMVEADMKKLVALSTLSQLGVMVMILSVGLKELAFFHLITHAMFKSTLFMCTGFMIHTVNGQQDGRVMSGFSVSSPCLGAVLVSTNLALCGFPFLAGFYSKDAILECMVMNSMNYAIIFGVVIGTALTVGYSFRFVYITSSQSSMSNISGASDISSLVLSSMVVLFLASLGMGFFMYWVFVPTSLPCFLKMEQKFFVATVSVLTGLIMVWYLKKSIQMSNKYMKVAEMGLSKMWFMPFLSCNSPFFFLGVGDTSMKVIDLGWFEYYGGMGGGSFVVKAGKVIQSSQMILMVSWFSVSVLVGGLVYISWS
uniref:NADH-ubiquinone oxidoreductase chain 5 n=1 Tax=Gammarus roeselii TaxID=1080772 RepID=A0A343VUL7_9CRUS|nr:NADH dehydrogenase subunit 5 [Gammarus roeselii]AVP50039.1 NADH dehydrogenase subunit 5 [Gammarus roeselii]